MTRDDVRELQRRLLFWFGAGADRMPPDYNAHDVDGLIGPRTRAAVVAFAKTTNDIMRTVLPVDGSITEELRGLLAVETERQGYIATDTSSRIRAAAASLAVVLPASSGTTPSARCTRHLVLGHVLRESLFGYAFATPDGSASNNWGSIYARGDLGRVTVRDTLDGKPVIAGAAWNSSPEVGAKQFVELLRGSYAPALDRAAAGDAWGYARALWRDGPNSKRPSYYTGFPPGNANSGAPLGTPMHSALDHYHRVLAYARMLLSGAREVASALDETLLAQITLPANPPGDVR